MIGAELASVDFQYASEEARRMANEWASEDAAALQTS